jgi:hypothetical protein
MSIAPRRELSSASVLHRKAELYRFLEQICQVLELTETQLAEAQTSYEAVADWLSQSSHPLLQELKLYAHGSTALGTTVRPLAREEFDVDLICLAHRLSTEIHPAALKAAVGARLREHQVYARMLEEKKRCWRLNYQRQFHLDISPTILNPACSQGGELVPDKKLNSWKTTNPTGYRKLFDKRALLLPRMKRWEDFSANAQARSEVAPFPEHGPFKGVLRRTVQLLKRHRDMRFAEVAADIAPISIIITTLASQSYEYCVQTFPFETELDVVIATVRLMPHFIEVSQDGFLKRYAVWNETTKGENFAERWNVETERARAFYQWHNQVLTDLEKIVDLEGLDVLTKNLANVFGSAPVNKVLTDRTSSISEGRKLEKIVLAPTAGLILGSPAYATPVPKNTFFGDEAD